MASSCRLCLGKAERPHFTSLFSGNSLSQDLPGRVSRISGVPISQHDGYPDRLCRSCMSKFTSLEKAMAKFQEVAKASYSTLSRKRPKETSSDTGVSPHTARSRPPAKRSRSRCLFPDNTGKLNIRKNQQKKLIIIIIGHTAQSMASVVSSSPLVDKSNRHEIGMTPPATYKYTPQLNFINLVYT